MSSLDYTPEGFFVHVRIDSEALRGGPYGRKLRTPYVATCADGRARRVWAICYGNAASHYVVVQGMRVFLSVDAEQACEQARNLSFVPPTIGIHDAMPGGSTPEEWPA